MASVIPSCGWSGRVTSRPPRPGFLGRRSRRRATATTVRPSLQRLLDAITAAPAWVTKPRRDTVATNALGRALLAPMLDEASGGNNARFIFLSPAARIFYPDWAQAEGAGHPPSTSHA